MAKTGKFITSLVRDGNNGAVQKANSIQTQDATGTPQTSPLTVSNSVLTLVVPDSAISCVMYSTANDVRVSDLAAATRYFVLKVSSLHEFDCARMANIYVIRDGGTDATLQFYFKLV